MTLARWMMAAASVLLSAAGRAAGQELTTSPLFSDGAVLQQGMAVPVWGTAPDGTEVTVVIGEQRVTTRAKDGRWTLSLQPLTAGGPFEMTISDGAATLTRKDIYVGEVWIASGQSNMQMTVAQAELPNATMLMNCSRQQIRLYNMPQPPGTGPLPELTTTWTAAGPNSVAVFSAVGYYFARELRQQLQVPVGIIHNSVGGSYAGAWMTGPTLRKLAGSGVYADGRLCRANVLPLAPYAIRGVVWYQGESDADNSIRYRTYFPGLVADWRRLWGQGDFPFLYVQLTGFNFYRKELPTAVTSQSTWAELREVQSQVERTVPNVAMVVTTDQGDPVLLHAPKKREIGRRLAWAALGKVYRKPNVAWKYPRFKSMDIRDGSVRVTFDNADDGLVVAGETITGFTLAGDDKVFHPAIAKLDGSTVVVTSGDVPVPVTVRYGWRNFPRCNLFSKSGLPASPFRSDRFDLLKCPKCRSRTGQGASPEGLCNQCGIPCRPYTVHPFKP